MSDFHHLVDSPSEWLRAARSVLLRRCFCLRSLAPGKDSWYAGKLSGYLDALCLLDESVESISVELE